MSATTYTNAFLHCRVPNVASLFVLPIRILSSSKYLLTPGKVGSITTWQMPYRVRIGMWIHERVPGFGSRHDAESNIESSCTSQVTVDAAPKAVAGRAAE